MGMAEIPSFLPGLPFAMFGPLLTIKYHIGTSAIPLSIFQWKVLGYPELIGKIPGRFVVLINSNCQTKLQLFSPFLASKGKFKNRHAIIVFKIQIKENKRN